MSYPPNVVPLAQAANAEVRVRQMQHTYPATQQRVSFHLVFLQGQLFAHVGDEAHSLPSLAASACTRFSPAPSTASPLGDCDVSAKMSSQLALRSGRQVYASWGLASKDDLLVAWCLKCIAAELPK